MMRIEYTFVGTMMWIKFAVKQKMLVDVEMNLYRIDEGEVRFHIGPLGNFNGSYTLLDLFMFCGNCEKLDVEMLTEDK
jgi:hypothetical protein